MTNVEKVYFVVTSNIFPLCVALMPILGMGFIEKMFIRLKGRDFWVQSCGVIRFILIGQAILLNPVSLIIYLIKLLIILLLINKVLWFLVGLLLIFVIIGYVILLASYSSEDPSKFKEQEYPKLWGVYTNSPWVIAFVTFGLSIIDSFLG